MAIISRREGIHSQHEDSSSPWRGLTYRYSGQDNARVKETILEHEVTFRNQVRELHRLYRRQRELMNAIQDNGLYKIQKKTESSQSLVFPSYLSSENGKRTLDRSHFISSDSVLGRLDPLSSLSHQPHTTVLKRKNCESFHPCSDMYLHKPVDLDISRGAHMNNEETVVNLRSFGMVGNVVFSGMKYVKDQMRNKMSNHWLNDCLITFVEKEVFSTIDDLDIIKRFQAMKKRKVQLELK